jgi:hypothetical protein
VAWLEELRNEDSLMLFGVLGGVFAIGIYFGVFEGLNDGIV